MAVINDRHMTTRISNCKCGRDRFDLSAKDHGVYRKCFFNCDGARNYGPISPLAVILSRSPQHLWSVLQQSVF